jgi:hypothetical protein
MALDETQKRLYAATATFSGNPTQSRIVIVDVDR